MPYNHLKIRDINPNFYRKCFSALLWLALALTIVCGILSFLIYIQFIRIATPPFFATTYDGRVVELKPLEK